MVNRQEMIRQKEGLADDNRVLDTFGLQFRLVIISSFFGKKSADHQFQLTRRCFEKIG